MQQSIPDKTVLKNVIQRMARKGVNSSRIKATVRNGDVSIAGTIDFEHERRSVVASVNSTPGVRRVIDQLRVEKKKRT